MRRIAWALLFWGLTLSASAQSVARLDNGLRVVVAQESHGSFAGVCVSYAVGGGDDPVGRRGLAHVLEHTMFTGTPHAPDGIHAILEPAGAIDINAFTSFDATLYCEEVPVGALELALWAEAERMGWLLASLTAEEVDRQRNIVLRERVERGAEAPGHRIYDIEAEELFPRDHPYRRLFEPEAALRRITLDDLRAFHQRWYGPANATVAVVAPLPPSEVHELVERYFGGLRGDAPPERPHREPRRLLRERRVELDRPVRTEELTIAWPTPPWLGPGDAELDLVATHLMRVVDERLGDRLRRFSISQLSRRQGSLFSIHLHGEHNVDALDLLAPVDAAIRELGERLRSPEALDDLRSRYVTRYRTRNDRARDHAAHLARSAAHGRVTSVEENVARFDAITPEGLRDAVRRHLPLDRRVIVHGQFVRDAPTEGRVRRRRSR